MVLHSLYCYPMTCCCQKNVLNVYICEINTLLEQYSTELWKFTELSEGANSYKEWKKHQLIYRNHRNIEIYQYT